MGFLLHCFFSVGTSSVLLNSGFKCSLPHRDGDSDSVHVSLSAQFPPFLHAGVLLCSLLSVVLQDPADAGGRMSFLVIFNIFLKDESQGEGQEVEWPRDLERFFWAEFCTRNFSPWEQHRAQPAACCS